LFCSQESSPDVVREALTLGFGYVHKLEVGIDLLPAFKAVLSGRRFVSSNLELDHAIAVRPPHHEIRFCSDDTAILDGLTRFIAAALKGGNASLCGLLSRTGAIFFRACGSTVWMLTLRSDREPT